MNMRLARIAAGGLAVVALIGAACGGDDDEDDNGGSNTPAATTAATRAPTSAATQSSGGDTTPSDGQGGTLAVTAQDFSFSLDADSIPTGSVLVTLTNEGAAPHTITFYTD